MPRKAEQELEAAHCLWGKGTQGCEGVSLRAPFPRDSLWGLDYSQFTTASREVGWVLFWAFQVPFSMPGISRDLESRVNFHNWLRQDSQLCPRTFQKRVKCLVSYTQTLGYKIIINWDFLAFWSFRKINNKIQLMESKIKDFFNKPGTQVQSSDQPQRMYSDVGISCGWLVKQT